MTEVYHFDIKPAVVESQEGSYDILTTHTGIDYARTSLPLDRRITVNDKRLYDDIILPAINKLHKPTNKLTPKE